MGKLSITGKAAREFAYDQMELTVSFRVHERTVAIALKKVLAQCEDFLTVLKNDGIDTKDIRIDENSLTQRFYSDGFQAEATRDLTIRVPFDMKFANYVQSLIEEQAYDADFEVEYYLSNESALRKGLIKEALADSREKAELIAEAMAQKIIGVKSMEIEDDYHDDGLMIHECELLVGGFEPKRLALSNELQAPLKQLAAAVEVVWLIE